MSVSPSWSPSGHAAPGVDQHLAPVEAVEEVLVGAGAVHPFRDAQVGDGAVRIVADEELDDAVGEVVAGGAGGRGELAVVEDEDGDAAVALAVAPDGPHTVGHRR